MDYLVIIYHLISTCGLVATHQDRKKHNLKQQGPSNLKRRRTRNERFISLGIAPIEQTLKFRSNP